MKKTLLLWIVIVVTCFAGCASQPEKELEAPPVSSQESTTDTTPNTDVEDNTETETEHQTKPSLSGAGTEISCMSFNVLSYNTGGQTLPSAEERFKGTVPFILETNADIVGIQEADTVKEFNWADALVENTASVYAARRIDEELEYGVKDMNIAAGLIILYRKDRFELKNSGASYYWEDSGRWYQWVQLYDKTSGRDVYVTNTHMSINPTVDGVKDAEQGNFLRCSESEELVNFWKDTVGDNPLFATGDYNSKLDAEPHTEYLMSDIYQPSCDVATESDGETSVDFVYVNPENTQVEIYDFMSRDYVFSDGSRVQMSDHAPVIAYCTFI